MTKASENRNTLMTHYALSDIRTSECFLLLNRQSDGNCTKNFIFLFVQEVVWTRFKTFQKEENPGKSFHA